MLVGNELIIAFHQITHQVQRIAGRDFEVQADIHHLADKFTTADLLKKATAGVGHIIGITHRRDFPTLDMLFATSNLTD
jgi:hypothetical protein